MPPKEPLSEALAQAQPAVQIGTLFFSVAPVRGNAHLICLARPLTLAQVRMQGLFNGLGLRSLFAMGQPGHLSEQTQAVPRIPITFLRHREHGCRPRRFLPVILLPFAF